MELPERDSEYLCACISVENAAEGSGDSWPDSTIVCRCPTGCDMADCACRCRIYVAQFTDIGLPDHERWFGIPCMGHMTYGQFIARYPHEWVKLLDVHYRGDALSRRWILPNECLST